ncbi:aldo/keto reductase [Methylobacterium sp. Leaf104]|uniref:aldo/keto reductase n=1 Tax=Methylobacterium TaxID=407 RepID=UPI0006F4EE25|nr:MULTISPECIES: aldo/keto reductase [Methylobacterium]KQP36405.1 aldo/keto reductase [Methylobacterium sp. Leaf104]MCI9878426.1 aldo/keto reductase [Methylobacterium goesingense]
MDLSRRAVLAGAGLLPLSVAWPGRPAIADSATSTGLLRRPIPSSGETLPVIGIGTSRRYEVEPTPEKIAPLREAVQRFVSLGGRVIDTAPSYGTAEDVLGLILGQDGLREKVFLCSKVGTPGREAGAAEIARSFQRLKTTVIDLIAVHNLIDPDANLATLRGLKAEGKIRYLGATVWRDSQLADLEALMARETLDFIQVNYALDDRGAAARILPLAKARGMAVMVNVPFGRDRLFKAVQGRELPPWAAEFDCATWPQFFLKYVLGHEAVTCPIPGMAKAAYVEDNLGAARGRLPDAAQRTRMEAFVDAL